MSVAGRFPKSYRKKRSEIETTVLRAPGTTYTPTDNGGILNVYELTVVNKTQDEKTLSLELVRKDGRLKLGDNNEFKIAGGDL